MNTANQLTFEDLKNRRTESLLAAEKAIGSHPEMYGEIKKLIKQALSKTIDIDEYYPLAIRLTKLLKTLTRGHPLSLFHYFHENLDPKQIGTTKYFRAVCRDLQEQLSELDRWRQRHRKIALLK